MNFQRSKNARSFRIWQLVVYLCVLLGALLYGLQATRRIVAETKSNAIENALYARAEFFGARAIVPFPTAEARRRLGELLKQFPNDAEISLKLAELDERLLRFTEAENEIKAAGDEYLQALAGFYGRRGAFEKQGEILERIMIASPVERRGAAFSELIFFAKRHDLKKYLAPDFYRQAIADNEGMISVLFEYVEKLKEEKNYAEARRVLEENRARFPALKSVFLEKEISILELEGNNAKAAETFIAAFDPRWSEDESDKFYEFLRENDRFRSYETDIKRRVKSDPADFEAAIRLIHFMRYEGDDFAAIVSRLEKTRAARKIQRSAEELLTVSRFLIEAGDGDAASRFLYTLCADPKTREKGELRRRVLYQIFELLSDAGDNRIALARGNLDFYESVARADMRPGITTGILSLIFADAAPRTEFEAKENAAVKLFNRAAAFRVFEEFKKEYADAPELAQMYLDVVRLYANSKNPEIAEQALAEFEFKTDNFADYADAALKLSDAFIAARRFDKEREIYQKLLDFLGKSGNPKFYGSAFADGRDLTQVKPPNIAYPPASNEGITDESAPKKTGDYYYYEKPNPYKNFLPSRQPNIFYADVLARYVASLARENLTQDILNLYAAEAAKYPQEEALVEQMLQWLGQTNLAEKQLEVYQKALADFPNKTWRDRFARWLLRSKRSDEFARFSRSFVETFDDAETQEYLKQFIDGKETGGAQNADGKMFFALYSLAHERFPHNLTFVRGLLRYFKQNKMETEWRALMAEYYFESPEIRAELTAFLAERGELRAALDQARETASADLFEALPYKLFRAEASAWLSDFENAAVFYRELAALYPNRAEFSEKYLTSARSLGQTNRDWLLESASHAQKQADNFPSVEDYHVRAGEIQAELGDYNRARDNWQKIIAVAAGEKDSYLNTATVFWDYFQFDDALRTIAGLRAEKNDANLYAFQTGAIFEAQNQSNAAIGEYLKALDENEVSADRWRAKERLKLLYQNPESARQIDAAFPAAQRSAKNRFRLTFNFADALFQMKRQREAVSLVLRQIESETSTENLLEAKQFFRDLDETEAQQKTLQRLIAVAPNVRDAIGFRLQLAESYREHYEPAKSQRVLAELLEKFPLNFGVVKETETFYWDLGEREKSIAVLKSARTRARGSRFYQLSRKLAARLSSANRDREAENILHALQNDDPNDEQVFADLTDIYVRTNNAADLRKTLAATLEALKNQRLEPREYKWRAATLRKTMIAAFTRLKDYDSAAEQYIEIINREPDDEALLEEAIAFATRYGGAARLTEYYENTARESFKDYRWNVVLARIYAAGGNLERAAENYRTAIFNQPEMAELYEPLGEIYKKMQNYEAALKTVEKIIELIGEDPRFIKEKAEILEKLGRTAEADAERAKLPAEELPKTAGATEKFAAAQNLAATGNEKAIAEYRAAFDEFDREPFAAGIKQSEIAAYIRAVSTADELPAITARLWNLRGKLAAETRQPDSVNSGKARENLRALDAAFSEAVGEIVKTKAGGAEISAFRTELENRLDSADDAGERVLLESLISACGFEDLREKMLLKNLQNSDEANRPPALRSVALFYQNRGDYRRVLEILGTDFANQTQEFLTIYAENARLSSETEKEAAALRELFARQKASDAQAARYLEILDETNRAELENLARGGKHHQLAVINFLLSKNELELAQTAIENSSFSDGWKSARAAQTSLKFGRFATDNELYFTNLLKPASIGTLVRLSGDEKSSLAGADWYAFSEQYGEWLFGADRAEKAELFVAARVEQNPKNAGAQFDLGYFYLKRKDYMRALEHLRLASALRPDDATLQAMTGAALFQLGNREEAFKVWAKIIGGDNVSIDQAMIYLKTLAEFGQTEKARADLKPFLLRMLKDGENIAADQLKPFLRQLAQSFTNETLKIEFFIEICQNAETDALLPELLIEESLVDARNYGDFYRILCERAEGFDGYEHDYDFVSVLETAWDNETAENLYDEENDFVIDESDADRLGWQRKYLEYLIERRDFAAASRIVAGIESSLQGRYPRPAWLRLAGFRLLIERGAATAALAKMMRFAGITLEAENKTAALPNLERFNRALDVLKVAGREDLGASLAEAFYARQIAVGQLSAANLTGLARAEFRLNNASQSLKILQIMTEIDSPAALAELDALPIVDKFKDREKLDYQAQNSLNRLEAFKLAAEMCAQFGFLNEAAAHRDRLLELSPNDSANRLELARLLAIQKRADEALRVLTETIAGKSFDRRERWQALVVLSEIAGDDEDFWQKISSENAVLLQDREFSTALGAMRSFQTGKTGEAIETLAADGATDELKFLRAVYEKRAGFDAPALRTFTDLSGSKTDFSKNFGFFESAPNLAQIDLFLKLGEPRAALRRAKEIEFLKNAAQSDFAAEDFKFPTLENRALLLKRANARELLDKLSVAAETIGDFAQAIEYLETRLKFEIAENAELAARLTNLKRKLAAATAAQTDGFVVDEKILSGF